MSLRRFLIVFQVAVDSHSVRILCTDLIGMARVGRKPSVCAGGSGIGNLRIVKVYHIAIGALLRIPAQCYGSAVFAAVIPWGTPGAVVTVMEVP